MKPFLYMAAGVALGITGGVVYDTMPPTSMAKFMACFALGATAIGVWAWGFALLMFPDDE